MKISKRVRDEFKEFGRQGGKIGGAKAARIMTPADKTARAKKAAAARWKKEGK